MVMKSLLVSVVTLCLALSAIVRAADIDERTFPKPIDVNVPPLASDSSVKYDYDIVYVRAKRAGDEVHKRFFTDFSQPVTMEPGADLMLLHPDGSEEVLVEGGNGSVTDPMISFDGEWVFYSHLYDLRQHNQWVPPQAGADIFKLHLKTRKIVKLTTQQFTPNTGAANWSSDYRKNEEGKTHFHYGVFNMGPCPLPGGRVAFTSNRDGFRPAKGYPTVALQLFVMDDDGRNVEKIGHFNISGALHPVVLRDGRIMFSSLESQGIRSEISWGIWTIHPDGTNWEPLVSAFDPGGASNGFHFQTQLSDGSIVVEEYYNQNNSGFGAFIKLPEQPLTGDAAFGPAFMRDSRNEPWRFGRHYNGKGKFYRMPFMPTGSTSLTPFTLNGEGPADPSILEDKHSPAVGKVTHPSAAPDNHLLACYSPGPVNHQYKHLPQLDGGIYLLKNGETVEQPAQMRLIKNDPSYNECWPRAVVPYRRIFGIDEPRRIEPLANDGSRSKELPEGTPFGLIGTSSFYHRDTAPGYGNARYAGLDSFNTAENGESPNWTAQGADAGRYSNADIHAVRIVAMEGVAHRSYPAGFDSGFRSHSASERLRILGEIPLRKTNANGSAVLDPQGNPDTSFLAKIPADTPFTFQTLDKDGLVLNMAQTWHMVRPGEVRTDCGGCHAHNKTPLTFAGTAAAKADYKVVDLTTRSLLLAKTVARDTTTTETTTKELERLVVDIEYYKDIKPILQRSCVQCHSRNGNAAAGLVLDDETLVDGYDRTYLHLASDPDALAGIPPVISSRQWRQTNASRYVRMFQSRRSLLAWKVFGRRLDGWLNGDHPTESVAGDPRTLPSSADANGADLDYTGTIMPPPGSSVPPLSEDEKMTIARWIDLGASITRQGDASYHGYYADELKPTLTVSSPRSGSNAHPVDEIRIGMFDAYSGIDRSSLSVVADVAINGHSAGTELAAGFIETSPGVWTLSVSPPLAYTSSARLAVSVRDNAGNVSRVERSFGILRPRRR